MAFRIGGIDCGVGSPPRQTVTEEFVPQRIALLGEDYRGLRPKFVVEKGDSVRAGDPLFTDRRRKELTYVAPASGKVVEISLGGRRALDVLVIALDDAPPRRFDLPSELTRETLSELLVDSGQWQALKTRPFDDTPHPGSQPQALFVTAIDTRPFSPDAGVVITRHAELFRAGLSALRLLCDGPTYLCHAEGSSLPQIDGVTAAAFSGPHPAGLAGTHIHKLHPVGLNRTVWHIGYQDVIAIGHLLETGTVWTRRVVSVAGDGIAAPALVETVPGADLPELCAGRTIDGPVRLVSGSPLTHLDGGRSDAYLARGHLQVTAFAQGGRRPGMPHDLVSRLRNFLSLGGDAIIPNAVHERAAPAGILPIPFLRAISVGDVETAQRLGALELAEEDMALLTHVDGGRTDFGRLLRRTLEDLREAG